MGNKTSSQQVQYITQDDLVLETMTNSGPSFKVALWNGTKTIVRSNDTDIEGIADVWANVFIDKNWQENETLVPIHLTTLVYKKVYIGEGDHALYSVLFELCGGKGRRRRYLHIGGDAGMVYFELEKGDTFMNYGVIEQNSSASSAYLVTGNKKSALLPSHPSRVYMIDEAISVPYPVSKKGVSVQATETSVVERLYMKYWDEQVPASVTKSIPKYTKGDPSRADFSDNIMVAIQQVEEENQLVQKMIRS